MFYALLKLIFKIALRVFFRKIHVRYSQPVPEEGPWIIVANHPNTFMDPIAIAAALQQQVFFMAKSTVFNSPLKSWLLTRMHLVPIYRREDGPVPAASNEATFQKCFELLQRKGSLLIFPEGNSFNERRLRPLKTGAARLALGAEARADFQAGVQILPVGLNYSDPTRFQGKLYLNIGAPIPVGGFAAAYRADAYKASQELTDLIRERLETLLVITASAEEDKLVHQVERLYRYNLLQDLGLSQKAEDRFVLTKGIADSIRYFNQHEPERVQALQREVDGYSRQLALLGLEDKWLRDAPVHSGLGGDILKTILFLLLGAPAYCWGLLTNYLPYKIPALVADQLTEEAEFRAPVMMTVGIFSFGLFYPLEIAGVYGLTGSALATYFFSLSLPLSGFFAWQYYHRLKLSKSFLRVMSVFYRRKALINNIIARRKQILCNLEAAKEVYLEKVSGGTMQAEKQPGI